MSALTEPKRAAEFGWPGGDHPGELEFPHPVAPRLADALLAALRPNFGSLQNAELRALTPPASAIGRFRLVSDDRAFFLRVSAYWGEPVLEQAVTAWLRDHAVPVNHLELAGIPFDFDERRLRLDVRKLIRGRHFDGSPDDLRELAATLARCHAALRDFPQQARVRELSARRFERLARVQKAMRSALERRDWHWFASDDWAETHRDWIEELMRAYQPRFDLLENAQCLHGQVHRANVIFAENRTPVLVDFEEAVHTFAPVAWDLAYFVQRFCLHDDPPENVRSQRLAVLREAYGAPVSGVAQKMRQTAWLSALVLIEDHSRGISSPRSEYEKFVRLEEQARSLAPQIGEHFDE